MSTEAQSIQKRGVSAFFTGMALFSMFFGAGNLIFPLLIGKDAGTDVSFATLGFAISAVGFPLLGLVAMMGYFGDLRAFLERIGGKPAFLLMAILYLAQGPVGSMPRLVTLMHASVKSYVPEMSLWLFSGLISLALFLLAYRPKKIIALLGVILTPLFLALLGILFFVGAYKAPGAIPSVHAGSFHFLEGLKGGYQTMDLFAALLFATLVMPHLAQHTEELPRREAKRVIYQRMLGASLVAAFLLMVSYIGLIWVSARYSPLLGGGLAPEERLQALSTEILGPVGGLVSALTVFVACLTTALSLAHVFADFLKREVFRSKKESPLFLIGTVAVTGLVANLGFTKIMKLYGPILDFLYPMLALLCLVNIFYKIKEERESPFKITQ